MARRFEKAGSRLRNESPHAPIIVKLNVLGVQFRDDDHLVQLKRVFRDRAAHRGSRADGKRACLSPESAKTRQVAPSSSQSAMERGRKEQRTHLLAGETEHLLMECWN